MLVGLSLSVEEVEVAFSLSRDLLLVVDASVASVASVGVLLLIGWWRRASAMPDPSLPRPGRENLLDNDEFDATAPAPESLDPSDSCSLSCRVDPE